MREGLDKITLRGLSAVGHHGVYEFERSGSQVFSADITLYVDARKAAETDDVAYTIDYSKVAEDAVNILTGEPVYLLETLADKLASAALAYAQVQSVEVTVHKPMAPVRHQFSDVSVTIFRDKKVTPGRVPAESGQTKKIAETPRVKPDRAPKPAPVKRAEKPKAAPVGAAKAPAKDAKPRTRATGVVLALGSNVGRPKSTLREALGALTEINGFEIDGVSSLYETSPVLTPGMEDQPNYFNAVVVGRTVLDPEELLHATQAIEDAFGRARGTRWGPRTLDIDIIDVGGKRYRSSSLILPHPRARERAFVLKPWSEVRPDARLLDGTRVKDAADRAADRAGVLNVIPEWFDESLATGAMPIISLQEPNVGGPGMPKAQPEDRARRPQPAAQEKRPVRQNPARPSSERRQAPAASKQAQPARASSPKPTPKPRVTASQPTPRTPTPRPMAGTQAPRPAASSPAVPRVGAGGRDAQSGRPGDGQQKPKPTLAPIEKGAARPMTSTPRLSEPQANADRPRLRVVSQNPVTPQPQPRVTAQRPASVPMRASALRPASGPDTPAKQASGAAQSQGAASRPSVQRGAEPRTPVRGDPRAKSQQFRPTKQQTNPERQVRKSARLSPAEPADIALPDWRSPGSPVRIVDSEMTGTESASPSSAMPPVFAPRKTPKSTVPPGTTGRPRLSRGK